MEFDNTLTSSLDTSFDASIAAKMRRLKIQEELLIKSIKKNLSLGHSNGDCNFIKTHLEFKKFVTRLKNTDADIKQLFDDVKCTTKSKEILETLDIDDVKKDVFELEGKIKSFKTFLQKEHMELKNYEKELIKQVEDDSQNSKTRKYTKLTTKSFSDIVPSPVKNIINAPFKCPEVQQFQDFICNSQKHGGWNEYNHNIFIRIWKKHFPDDALDYEIDKMDILERDIFIDEVFEKVSGIKKNDIINHINWYAKFLHLKKRQQMALEEWRTKTKPKSFHKMYNDSVGNDNDSYKSRNFNDRRKKLCKTASIRGRPKGSMHYFSDDSLKYSSHEEDKIQEDVGDSFFKDLNGSREVQGDSGHVKNESGFRFMRSTKQWENRCSSASEYKSCYNNVEDLRKLGIPSWRQGLEKEE